MKKCHAVRVKREAHAHKRTWPGIWGFELAALALRVNALTNGATGPIPCHYTIMPCAADIYPGALRRHGRCGTAVNNMVNKLADGASSSRGSSARQVSRQKITVSRDREASRNVANYARMYTSMPPKKRWASFQYTVCLYNINIWLNKIYIFWYSVIANSVSKPIRTLVRPCPKPGLRTIRRLGFWFYYCSSIICMYIW